MVPADSRLRAPGSPVAKFADKPAMGAESFANHAIAHGYVLAQRRSSLPGTIVHTYVHPKHAATVAIHHERDREVYADIKSLGKTTSYHAHKEFGEHLAGIHKAAGLA